MKTGQKSYVYIMTNQGNSTIYIGVTGNIMQRVFQHKSHAIPGFSARYNTTKLVYIEEFNAIDEAIAREKQLKKWNRDKKNQLIETLNPHWMDLSKE